MSYRGEVTGVTGGRIGQWSEDIAGMSIGM
jgi:hypothetical protein